MDKQQLIVMILLITLVMQLTCLSAILSVVAVRLKRIEFQISCYTRVQNEMIYRSEQDVYHSSSK